MLEHQASSVIINPEVQVVINEIQSHRFTHTLIPERSVEHLLGPKPCSRHLGSRSERDAQGPQPHEVYGNP